MGLYLGSLFCSTDLSFLFFANTFDCLDYFNITLISFTVNLKVRLFHLILAILIFCIFHMDFRIDHYTQYNLLGFWIRLHWTYKSSWEELRYWQCGDFLLMNMKCLSSYLDIWFLFLEFCSFYHVDLIHILLDVYLNILFGVGGANVNATVFLMSVSTYSFV